MYFDDAHYSVKTLQHTAIEYSECKHSTYPPYPLPPLQTRRFLPASFLRRCDDNHHHHRHSRLPLGGRWVVAVCRAGLQLAAPFPRLSCYFLPPNPPSPPPSPSPSLPRPSPTSPPPFPTSHPGLPSPLSVCHNSFSSLFSLALLSLDTPLSIFRGTLEPEPSHILSVLRMELRVVANTGKQRAGRGFCVYVCLWTGTCRSAQSPRPVPRVRGCQE